MHFNHSKISDKCGERGHAYDRLKEQQGKNREKKKNNWENPQHLKERLFVSAPKRLLWQSYTVSAVIWLYWSVQQKIKKSPSAECFLQLISTPKGVLILTKRSEGSPCPVWDAAVPPSTPK